MRKTVDKLFTGAVLICLVSSAFISYYLRPWRWLRFNQAKPAVPDDPFAGIPLPDATEKSVAEKVEKAVA
jgi:hypothetical protein